jgi:hypothetical protein
MKPEMRSLLDNLGNVGDLTYVGVGSAIHDLPGLNNKSDQILPLFVREMLSIGTRVTAIHFDPMFKIDVMKEYFNRYTDADLRHLGFAWHWRLKDLEVYILPYAFEHKGPDSDVDFLEALIHRVLLSRGSLILQQYTGYDPVDTFKGLYAASMRQSDFKDRVLFDVSYGADTGCCTDLTRWKPIYAPHGGFMNFLLYDMDEMTSIIGYNQVVDKLIFDYFKKDFIKTVNDNHVNYRRRCKEDTCLFLSGMPYEEMSDPEAIMKYLKSEIWRFTEIFKRLGMLTPEKEVELAELMRRYKAADGVNVSDWYSAVTKIV